MKSMAFFRPPGTEWLYSGLTMMKASNPARASFQATAAGSLAGAIMGGSSSAKMGRLKVARSRISAWTPSTSFALEATHSATEAPARLGRTDPRMTAIVVMTTP